MKKLLVKILIVAVAVAVFTGCGRNNGNDIDDPYGFEDDPDIAFTPDADGSEVTENIIYTSEPDAELNGTYDSIFNTEIIMESPLSVSYLVRNGYQFEINSSAFCKYFEGTGPVVVVGDQLQYKLVVQDKTFDEIKQGDVTKKAVDAGAEVKSGPTTVNEDGLEYIVFSYVMDGERGIAINMPGPDVNHAIGVQIAVLDDQVTDEEAIAAALAVARTAQITDASDTTAEEIESQYGISATLSGKHVEKATTKYSKHTYTYPVPENYNQTYESFDDKDIGLQEYKSVDATVSVLYSSADNFTDGEHYLTNMLMWDIAEEKSDVAFEGDVAYITTHSSEFNFYAIHAAKKIDDSIFYVECESDTRKVNFDDVKGFFSDSAAGKTEPEGVIGKHTAIKSDQLYKGTVTSESEAHKLIAQYGEMQRERYNNPEVTSIEIGLQEKYGIDAVNFGELDIETAKELERGISYMFDTYPMIKGSLNTISLANFEGRENSYVALTQTVDFITESVESEKPRVVRNEIVLNANKWLNRDKMMQLCKENVDSGYWFKNANDPSKIIVHELGHQLLDAYTAKEYGFVSADDSSVYMPVLLTDANWDAYLSYVWGKTALNQDVEKALMEKAYKEWKSAGNKGDEEAFRTSISQYANGIKGDGGVSYHETFAEAVADIYCNGDDAAEASKCILRQITK